MSKKWKEDPYRQREAEKYEHPVPSREFIIEYLKAHDSPVTYASLLKEFHLDSEAEREGLSRRLKAMQRDGQIMSTRRGGYGLAQEMELIPGRISGHKDGFGFLIPDKGEGGSDVFLSQRQMQGVFSEDRVLVRVTGSYRGRREGVIVEILERNTQQVVGRYFEENGIAYVDPDDKSISQDILVPPGKNKGAKIGQFVVARILTQPEARHAPTGEILEVLGDQLTPGMEVELAIRSRNLPFEWLAETLEETAQLPDTVTEKDLVNRKDLRQLAFVTIDGEDAKDFDDAIYCEPYKRGWKLYVAIADVSHYVTPNSALDKEALLRGNSVYFPSRVIPMLPEKLSNGLCSLRPNVDRLAMVCEMDVHHQGKIKHYEFYEAVIHSHARLTYEKVAESLAGNLQVEANILPHLQEFHRLYEKLDAQRKKRGAIEFESVETKIEFDSSGKIDKIVPRNRNIAHKMIEEAMLAANVCTASFLDEAKIHALYRVHDEPDPVKVLALRDFLKAFALRLGGGKKPQTKDYAELLEKIIHRTDAQLLQTVMLRSLQQAIYSPENKGHFGLAYTHYTHFTSPIRRYPDLIVHRAIKHIVHKKHRKEFLYDQDKMQQIASHSSMSERRADLATRDATDWLKCEYMQNKLGQEFDGLIVEVTSFGVFVELKRIYVQGLIHITALKNDYYHYDAIQHALTGKRSGKTYRIGDSLSIKVARVDLNRRQIDFELVL